jgi:hypothetical protein
VRQENARESVLKPGDAGRLAGRPRHRPLPEPDEHAVRRRRAFPRAAGLTPRI